MALSGLYGDLPEAKNNPRTGSGETSSWSQTPKLAPTRRPSFFGPPASVLRAASKTKSKDGDAAAPTGSKTSDSQAAGPVLGPPKQTYVDEYDPARPNEYDDVRRDREQQRHEAQQEAERQEQLRHETQERERERQAREQQSMQPQALPGNREAALSISGEEAFLRRGRMSKTGGRAVEPQAEAAGSFAQRMMERMGWKEGLGLGKAHQGITTPLMAQKTDTRSGVIVNAQARRPDATDMPPEKKTRGVAIRGTPTRVILLRNIVGPGEVDDSLEDEIGEECSKYGQISKILIFEVTEPGFPPDQAVRIFVEFERMESATKALIDLEGRFFGGRRVSAVFFSEQKFDREEIAPAPGELT